jgi:hypothetical protein
LLFIKNKYFFLSLDFKLKKEGTDLIRSASQASKYFIPKKQIVIFANQNAAIASSKNSQKSGDASDRYWKTRGSSNGKSTKFTV